MNEQRNGKRRNGWATQTAEQFQPRFLVFREHWSGPETKQGKTPTRRYAIEMKYQNVPKTKCDRLRTIKQFILNA